MAEHQHCQVVTTTNFREAADALSRAAVEARVAACAQIVGPIASTYCWQGRIETTEEWQVVFKTTFRALPGAGGEHPRPPQL